MTDPTPRRREFVWLLDEFVRSTPGTTFALVVSADGLLMTMSQGVDRTRGDQLAAIVSGISSLTRGAARELGGRQVAQCVVELDSGFLVLMNVSGGSVLAVAADTTCDVGVVGYEMAMLASRAQTTLTPQLVSDLRRELPVDSPSRTEV
ncbi:MULTISPECIES: roadblock/LC7 domain-containing protein [Micrococcales]|jgi:predicted regulator of Ras-like GTPase activity (Roadblock/LC7/MglB family)|uniref:roadblock/LC7 domain-containing protein n=1 Tax=Micrococcales TaxID=85006 RepID=UPI00130E1825|nr:MULTISPECIES: roadblock/LC7 domain-containing protein [Micrococcales]MBW0255856.1 roadblock/LC7 domain-containing protein [Cellulomonas sp. PS-H5]